MLDESSIVRTLLRDRAQVLSYIDSFLGDYPAAEDCYQDVCAAAVSNQSGFESETHLLRWVMRVGRNKSIDLVRKRSRQPVLLDDDVLELLEAQWFSADQAHRGGSTECVESLRACLNSLTDNNRHIIELRYTDGMKTGRIAEVLGRKVESVYRALTRAHVQLRDCMDRTNELKNTSS